MDEARVCLKTGWKDFINEKVSVLIGVVSFIIVIREEQSSTKDPLPFRRSLEDEASDSLASTVELLFDEEASGDDGGGIEASSWSDIHRNRKVQRQVVVGGLEKEVTSLSIEDTQNFSQNKKLSDSKAEKENFDLLVKGCVSALKHTLGQTINDNTASLVSPNVNYVGES